MRQLRSFWAFPPAILLAFASLALAQSGQLTGTHFPNTSDFPTLKLLGYDFAVVTVNPDIQSSWAPPLDAAQAAGLKLIVGAYPPPYAYLNGGWSITSSGMGLLNYLRSRSNLILAVFVFNEPYSTDPYTGQQTPCGAFSAADLRNLRSTIQAFWPGVKIYQDLGAPTEWVPGSAYTAATPCVGNKYADQTGVADYVGIWYDPFRTNGFERSKGLSVVSQEANYVRSAMGALPISLNQAFACLSCEQPGLVFPTPAQMLDWNCATRALPLAGIDWYPWRRFTSYTQALADTPSYWPLSTAAACRQGMGAEATGVSSASGKPFVAPNSLVSIYGPNLSFATISAQVTPFPTSLGGVAVQVLDSAGNRFSAPLAFVSPNQINFVMPAGSAPGQAAISVDNGSGTPVLGTALVMNVAPSLFSADGSGSGPIAATALRIVGAQQIPLTVFQCNGITCTAAPIDLSGGAVYMSLYGTGIRNHTTPVSVTMNGVSVPVQYAGPQGQYDGLDQINLGPMPALNGSGRVNVVVTVDGQTSNPVIANFL